MHGVAIPIPPLEKSGNKETNTSCHGPIGPIGTFRDPTFFFHAIFNRTVGLRLCVMIDGCSMFIVKSNSSSTMSIDPIIQITNDVCWQFVRPHLVFERISCHSVFSCWRKETLMRGRLLQTGQ